MKHINDIVCLIPARGGSKGLPRKNILDLAGKPLIAHSIDAALATPSIKRVFVSTDDEEIAEVAKDYGAEVPFLRPGSLARDNTTDYPVFEHFVGFMDEEGITGDAIVHLRPTCPIRKPEVLESAIQVFSDSIEANYTSLRSVSVPKETPYKMWKMNGDKLEPLLDVPGVPEPFNEPRQSLPNIFWQNGYVDVYRSDVIRELKSCSGPKIRGFVVSDRIFDIDYLGSLIAAEEHLQNKTSDTLDQFEHPG